MVENVMPSDDAPHPARMLDMTMLMITDGGRERTEDEYADLLARAGFRLERVIPDPIVGERARGCPLLSLPFVVDDTDEGGRSCAA